MQRRGFVWFAYSMFASSCGSSGDRPDGGGPSTDVVDATTVEPSTGPSTAQTSATEGSPPSDTGATVGSDGTSDPASTADTSDVHDSESDPGTLSDRYPGDVGLANDPAVLFFDDFEQGWGRWTAPQQDTPYLHMETDEAAAHRGSGYLRSTVTSADLDAQEYISSQSFLAFERPVDEVHVRFYAQFVETAPPPHHWVRMTAGTPAFEGSGLANTLPAGNDGFWFDFDVNTNDVFNFYVYWHEMRSGRCNDGTTVEGCEGDQGTTYYYGNVFRPPGQDPFARDRWFCIEFRARANTVGSSDGALTFWIEEQEVGDFGPGHPEGTWLRDTFHPGGCTFSACTEPVPFEGFAFRTAEDVQFKAFVLDAYYERESSASKREALEERGVVVSDAQTILYDNVVVATERIGCRD